MNYNDLPTDELLELLPDNFQLARRSHAPAHDKWRLMNTANNQYSDIGGATAREVLITKLIAQDAERDAWVNTKTPLQGEPP